MANAQTIPITDSTALQNAVDSNTSSALIDSLPPTLQGDSLENRLSVLSDSLPPQPLTDSLGNPLPLFADSLGGFGQTPPFDTPGGFTAPSGPRTDLSKIDVSSDSLDAEVSYSARDSMKYDIANERIILYGNASVTYDGTSMNAGYIVFDKKNNVVEADGIPPDNPKAEREPPNFENGNQSFTAGKMRYNFETGKGVVYEASTKQQMGPGNEMFVQSGKAKFSTADTTATADSKQQEIVYSKDAIFSTCNHPNPHFGIRSKKQKVIPNKLVVVGPSNLEISGIPTPIWLPFGAFPIGFGAQTGLIFSNNIDVSEELGIGIRDVGWYFPLGDNMNLQLTGDIYTRGTWGLKGVVPYRKRYKYSGNLTVRYNSRRTENSLALPVRQNSFSVNWSHNQDRAAHPTNTFGGSINFQTNNDQQRNLNSAEDVQRSSLSSNVNFRKIFPGKPFDLGISARHSQNTQSRQMTVELPNVNFRMKTINPFKAKKPQNKGKWYEKIAVSYNMNALNRLTGTDTTFFEPQTFEQAKIGIQHRADASAPFRLFKFFTVSPNASYTEAWNFTTIRRRFFDELTVDTTTIEGPSGESLTVLDTTSYGIDSTLFLRGFEPWRSYRVAVSVNTRVYGVREFSRGPIRGIRHTINPTVSFSYTPDYTEADYLRDFIFTNNSTGQLDTTEYSIFQNSAYSGAPRSGPAMAITYGLNNNFEAKLWSKKDSTEKKIKLFDNVSVNGNYNFIRDSLKWSDISINGRTRLFKGLTIINMRASYSPYDAIYTNGRASPVNTFYLDSKKRLFRFVNASVGITNSIRVSQIRGLFEGKGLNSSGGGSSRRRSSGGQPGGGGANQRPGQQGPESLWDVLDNFSIQHVFNIDRRRIREGRDTTTISSHSITIRGNLKISPKWSITLGQISYNFKDKRLVYPDLTFVRDLHCWEMSMSWRPTRGTYFFSIYVKPGSFLERLRVPYQKNNVDGVNAF
ncbi:MAG: putative LPS assembly protein LptD [Bacteroidota bacterium]